MQNNDWRDLFFERSLFYSQNIEKNNLTNYTIKDLVNNPNYIFLNI